MSPEQAAGKHKCADIWSFGVVLWEMMTGYQVAPDGNRFLVLTEEQSRPSQPLTVVSNWLEAVKK